MIRTILATAAVLSAAIVVVPEAQACISCEYQPEVLGKAAKSARVQKRVRVDAAVKARKARPAKERLVTRKPSDKRPVHAEPVRAEKAPVADEKTTTAKATGNDAASPRAQSVYNTLIKTTEPADTPDVVPPVATPEPPVATVPDADKKSVATADSAPAAEARDETAETAPAEGTRETVTVSQQKGDKATGCKKFFPMADITLTVDCK